MVGGEFRMVSKELQMEIEGICDLDGENELTKQVGDAWMGM